MGKSRVSNNIRRWRFERDEMTQKDLAERVGVTRQTIIAIEAAKYSPSLELAFLIAQAFGVALDEVFSFETGRSEEASKLTGGAAATGLE